MKSAQIAAFFIAWLSLPPFPLYATPVEFSVGTFDGGGTIVLQREVTTRQDLLHKNVVIQERDFSCGTASLATVLNFYLGKSISETQIIRTLLDINKSRGTLEDVIRRRGFSLLDLKLFAENEGFKATGYRLDFDDLAKLGVPVIVPIIPSGFKHFVVFRGSDKSRVYLADPSFGNLIQSIDEFKRDWYGFSNVALVVLPSDGHKPEQHPMSITELDKVFAGDEGYDTFRYNILPERYFVPGEF